MEMDAEMWWGMALICAGIAAAAWGLLPRRLAGPAHAAARDRTGRTPLGPAHWRLMAVLTLALVIDVMKPASLGFVVPRACADVRGCGARWRPGCRSRRSAAPSPAGYVGALANLSVRRDDAVGGDVRRHLDLRRHVPKLAGTSACASSWVRPPAACCR